MSFAVGTNIIFLGLLPVLELLLEFSVLGENPVTSRQWPTYRSDVNCSTQAKRRLEWATCQIYGFEAASTPNDRWIEFRMHPVVASLGLDENHRSPVAST